MKTCLYIQYTLETFTEKRQTCWVFEPYMGGHVDGPSKGLPECPWDVVVDQPEPFHNNVTTKTVKHTECVKVCHGCGGVGRKRCYNCGGSAWVKSLVIT